MKSRRPVNSTVGSVLIWTLVLSCVLVCTISANTKIHVVSSPAIGVTKASISSASKNIAVTNGSRQKQLVRAGTQGVYFSMREFRNAQTFLGVHCGSHRYARRDMVVPSFNCSLWKAVGLSNCHRVRELNLVCGGLPKI